MKIMLFLAAVTVAGCSATPGAAPNDGPRNANQVVLATFTADVDLDAGTFVIRTDPPTAGASPQSGVVANLVNLDSAVTVANAAGSAWTNSATPPCTNSSPGNTWGADVTVTNNLSGSYVSGVYAEITRFNGATGLESCSNAAAPTGLSNTYGLWSYGLVAPGATKATSTKWIFKYASATKFSFSGRILGVKVDPADVSGGSQRTVSTGDTKMNVVADNGSTLVVSTGASAAIDFVDSTTGAWQKSVTTSLQATAIAIAPLRIWWGSVARDSSSFDVGWMDRDGANPGSATVAADTNFDMVTNRWVSTIVPDPTSPNTKAWVVYNNWNGTYIRSYTIGQGAGGLRYSGFTAYSAALGTDNRLYVADGTDNLITPFDLTMNPPGQGTALTTPGTFAGENVNVISRGLDSMLYYNVASKIYRRADASIPTTVGTSVSVANGLVASATGEAWATGTNARVARVDSGPNYVVDLPANPTTQAAVATCLSNGYLWVTTNDGKLWRVTTQ